MASYVTAPVVDGRADWSRAVELPETAELWRRRAALWRAQRDRLAAYALERLMRHPAVPHQGVDRVRAYLAGERRLP